MANVTYTPIATYTVSGSSVTFSNIPQTYTDLVLIGSNVQVGTNGYAVGIQYNGDNSNIYYQTFLNSGGSTPGAWRNYGASGWNNTPNTSAGYSNSNANGGFIVHFMNYSSQNMYKTTLFKNAQGTTDVTVGVGTYASTNNIYQLTLALQTNGTASISGTYTLYGIQSAAVGAYATGGQIYQDSNYFYHAFTGSGTFIPSQALTADVLVVAGAGGGGGNIGGGGGAGGLITFASQSLSSGNSYTCTVGAGGSGGTSTYGVNGGNSQFGGLTAAIGGGGGGGPYNTNSAQSGGSGGGGPAYNSSIAGGNGTVGQGNNGGAGKSNGNSWTSGGGGGAGENGYDAVTATNGGNGGNGFYSSLTDAIGTVTSFGKLYNGHYYFAGGGGGCVFGHVTMSNGVGGLGGGGIGAVATDATNTNCTSGLSNTGGGGGGAELSTYYTGGNGGSGIIIVRYPK